jgi:hypothetical protein
VKGRRRDEITSLLDQRTLDGGCHHEAGLPPDEESMRYWTADIARADALLFGRVTYEMMESAWRKLAAGGLPDWMGEGQSDHSQYVRLLSTLYIAVIQRAMESLGGMKCAVKFVGLSGEVPPLRSVGGV